jgi:iron complex transport system permease protein
MNQSPKKRHWRRGIAFAVLALIAIPILAIAAISLGQIDVPFGDTIAILANKLFGLPLPTIDGEPVVSRANTNIVWLIRTPRVLGALLVGAGLALAGSVMQATVQNPLADPYIIGVSNGAALGAVIAILLHVSLLGAGMGLVVLAFVGALAAALLALTLASIGSKMSTVKLVLAGVVISALCTALMNFIITIASDTEGIQSVVFWKMGSLAPLTWDSLPLLTVVLAVATVFFCVSSRILNTLLLGDEAAITLGVNIVAWRRVFLIASALLTAAFVSTCGIIGFVGLIIPHAVRALVGSDHRRLIPACILVGALFLLTCDLFARLVMPATELPIGIVTALVGAPFFMYILVRKGYGFGNR